ncbi:hypothetical protein ACGFWD_37975 [Streptomyces sp. NPDC048448]|uniref:hypothetical protein n=1 Tax=Streptomyces sp. NPDC048448 TaxID=3365554 RepID=UPI00371FA86A
MSRGLIAPLPDGGVIRDGRGETVFDSTVFDYVDGPALDTVNPSLWRQSRIFKHAGLFQVLAQSTCSAGVVFLGRRVRQLPRYVALGRANSLVGMGG